MVAENTVIRFILNSKSAFCRLHSLHEVFIEDQGDCSYGYGYSYILDCLNKFRRIKVFLNSSDLSQSMVFVFIKGMRMCVYSMNCKKGMTCPFLHLCPDFVSGTCSRVNCQYSHSFHDEHNLSVVKTCGNVHMCSDDQVLLELVRCCTPIVCPLHNGISGSGCDDPEVCLKLHVCNEYLCQRCLLSDSDCTFGHDLYSERNMKLLTLLELQHLRSKDEKLLRRMILKAAGSYVNRQVPRKKGEHNMDQSVVGHVYNKNTHDNNKKFTGESPSRTGNCLTPKSNVGIDPSKRNPIPSSGAQFSMKLGNEDELLYPTKASSTIKTEFVGALGSDSTADQVKSSSGLSRFDGRSGQLLEEFESHECSSTSVCTNRHVLEPYFWRLKSEGKWIPLEEQSEIENAFCDPDCSQFLTKFKSNQIKIDFAGMTCHLGDVQRLSTQSYVNLRDKNDATRWLWYWREGDSSSSLWILYEDDKAPYQDVLESKYLNDRTQSCWFDFETANSEQYVIDFVEMKQTNLRTGFKRDVRRRPADKSNNNKIKSYLFDPNKLPINAKWVPMNTEINSYSELVPITQDSGRRKRLFCKVENKFFETISRDQFKIEHVYYVQNLCLWKNYQEAKKRMESSYSQLGRFERHLFHGTVDEETVKCICHQNFDPRMHGVHGTYYGKGTYFATTAKYSHSYTKPFVNGGTRKMFLARVLVGKSTLGVTDYPRPPPLDSRRPHGALYDSCVNDVSNPSIYVVFGDEQSYPEFIIEYKELQAGPAVPPRPVTTTRPANQALGYQMSQYNQTQAALWAASKSNSQTVGGLARPAQISTAPVVASSSSYGFASQQVNQTPTVISPANPNYIQAQPKLIQTQSALRGTSTNSQLQDVPTSSGQSAFGSVAASRNGLGSQQYGKLQATAVPSPPPVTTNSSFYSMVRAASTRSLAVTVDDGSAQSASAPVAASPIRLGRTQVNPTSTTTSLASISIHSDDYARFLNYPK